MYYYRGRVREALRSAAFAESYREYLQFRGESKEKTRIDELEPLPLKGTGPAAIEEIFAEISQDRMSAARKVLAYLDANPNPGELVDTARVLIFLKGRDSHDYKFSSAVLEDYERLSPPWRDRLLAASVFYFRGSGDRDNDLVHRTRAALGA